MTKKTSIRLRDVDKPDGQFVMLTGEMLASPAWRSLSINARRLLDFLMIEQLRLRATVQAEAAASDELEATQSVAAE